MSTAELAALFPDAAARASGYLAVDPPHELHWSRHGRAGGEPVLVLHGGPGTGTTPNLYRLCDPARFDIVTFDQRGAGRSRPFGAREGNDLPALVADIERLRHHLAIDRWIVVGGSWGSTLALAYAEAHPEAVVRIVMWGTWLFRPADIDWYLYGARPILPEAWTLFADAVGCADGGDLLAAYAARIFDPDPAVHEPAAVAWKTYERRRRALTGWRAEADLPRDAQTVNMARLMLHYCAAGARTLQWDILGRAGRLRGIPGAIVHGRYDLVCPFSGALDLARAWPAAELVDIAQAGHTLDEPPTLRAVLQRIHR